MTCQQYKTHDFGRYYCICMQRGSCKSISKCLLQRMLRNHLFFSFLGGTIDRSSAVCDLSDLETLLLTGQCLQPVSTVQFINTQEDLQENAWYLHGKKNESCVHSAYESRYNLFFLAFIFIYFQLFSFKIYKITFPIFVIV